MTYALLAGKSTARAWLLGGGDGWFAGAVGGAVVAGGGDDGLALGGGLVEDGVERWRSWLAPRTVSQSP